MRLSDSPLYWHTINVSYLIRGIELNSILFQISFLALLLLVIFC